MKQQKNWIKILREQQVMVEAPSPQVWKRIEDRLDFQYKQRKQTGVLRLMALAAGIAAIALSSGLWQIGIGQNHSKGTFQLETLSSAQNDPQAFMAIELQRNLTAHAQGIQEGVPGKKFR